MLMMVIMPPLLIFWGNEAGFIDLIYRIGTGFIDIICKVGNGFIDIILIK